MALLALAWGLIAGSALFIGATVAWVFHPPPRLLAILMAFASGVLLSVAAFDLLEEAFADAGFVKVSVGYVGGAVLFSFGLMGLNRAGARNRKRSNVAIGDTANASGVVALATVLDGIPESLIIGLSFFRGEGLATAALIAVFLSNVPESLSSTTRMRLDGRSVVYTYGVWTAVAVTSGIASLTGYLILDAMPEHSVAVMQSIAGGALMVYIADAMIPEAFDETRDLAGLVTALGFLTAFGLSHGFT